MALGETGFGVGLGFKLGVIFSILGLLGDLLVVLFVLLQLVRSSSLELGVGDLVTLAVEDFVVVLINGLFHSILD